MARTMCVLVFAIVTVACGTAPVAQTASTVGPTAATNPSITAHTSTPA